VFIIGHTDCGMGSVNPGSMIEKFKAEGITDKTINTLEYYGLNLERWLQGFDDVNESVRNSVKLIRNHPLLPKIPVHGLVISSNTGKLDVVEDGYLFLETKES
jgi:carbonic anhydrase